MCYAWTIPLIDYLFIIICCLIRSAMMYAKASLVILETVVLTIKSNIESTSGYLWLITFKLSIAANIFCLKWEKLILEFKSEWVIASFQMPRLHPFLTMYSLSKWWVDVLYKTIKDNWLNTSVRDMWYFSSKWNESNNKTTQKKKRNPKLSKVWRIKPETIVL